MRRFELVIFDCDGVLVNSELITNRVFAALLQELGLLPVTLEFMFESFVGRSMQQCWQQVARMLGKEVPAHTRREFQLRTTAALAAEVQAVRGSEAVLDSLEVPYCVASSGSHAKMATSSGRDRPAATILCLHARASLARVGGAVHVQQYGQASRTALRPVY
jgi:beta-phosphoglucomutase-like phosphatase (HAD superfamily)